MPLAEGGDDVNMDENLRVCMPKCLKTVLKTHWRLTVAWQGVPNKMANDSKLSYQESHSGNFVPNNTLLSI